MTDDDTWTYTWEHGRELLSLTKDGVTWTNTYNADGLRTKRTDGTTTYNYVYNGSSLSQMTVGTHLLNFVYDASGAPMAVTYNDVTYYYVTNLQGDVIAILDGTGTAVVQYVYDAWGKLWDTSGSMATTLGVHNPLRYRGYVYDPESALYYLQSRYYDPELGRFINADAFSSTGAGVLGNNMFAYCNNNPVSFIDDSGCMPSSCAVAINDCGSGISSIEILILNKMSESTSVSTTDVGYSSTSTSRVSEYEVTIDVSNFELALMGKSDGTIFVEAGTELAGKHMPEMASKLFGLILRGISPLLDYVHYTTVPELPNGVYTVYDIDSIVSQVYTKDANGSPQRIDYHTIVRVYDLTSASGNLRGYTVIDYEFYTETHNLGG